jgi:hypothetical protein
MGTWGGVLAVVLVLAGAGCSDDDGGDDDADRTTTTTTEVPDEATDGTLDPCPYVPTEAVAEAMALPVELADGGADGCDFILGAAATLLIGPEPTADQDDCAADTLVEEDDDWACIIDAVPTAVVTDGDAAAQLTVTGEVAGEVTRDALVRLLPDVTPAA